MFIPLSQTPLLLPSPRVGEILSRASCLRDILSGLDVAFRPQRVSLLHIGFSESFMSKHNVEVKLC